MFNTKKLTKLFAIGALALGVLVVAGCGDDTSKDAKVNPDAKVINVATRGTVRPYSYTDDNGNLTGFDVELLKEIERRNPDLHFNFKPMAVDAAFVAMDAGQVDMIANQMRRNPTREAKFYYTNEVNNYSTRKLVVKNDRNDISKLDDLKGKKIAVTTSSEFNELVKQFNETANPQIEVIYTDKAGAETLNLVATGRADAAGEYEYVINSAIKDRGLPLKAVGDVLAVVPTYFLSKRTDDMKQVNEKIDKTMKEMRADGTLKKLSEQYLGGDYTFLHDPSVSTALELCACNGINHRYFCHLRCYFGLYHSHHSPQEGTSIKPIIYRIYLLYAGHSVLGTALPYLLWGTRNHVPHGA